LATALVTLNFSVMAYIQGLWPEYLHYIFVLPGLYFFILYGRKRKISYLVASSLSLAYAAFTKGIVGHFYFILLIMFFILNRDKLFSKKFILPVIAFMLPYLACIGIQKISNYSKYGIFALSTNIWVNIEASVIPEDIIQQEGYKTVYDRYIQACDDSAERESLSKKRVFEYLKSATIIEILNHQLSNYARLMNRNLIITSYHKGRWHNSSPIFIFAHYISIFLSWFLFIFGISGAVISIRNRRGAMILIGYIGYYLAALFIVGFNARFFIQAIPFLAIFSVITLSRLFRENQK
jgi:hypothetical protein